MRGIPDFLTACSRGINMEVTGKTTFVDHVLKNTLGHGGTADIAVADE